MPGVQLKQNVRRTKTESKTKKRRNENGTFLSKQIQIQEGGSVMDTWPRWSEQKMPAPVLLHLVDGISSGLLDPGSSHHSSTNGNQIIIDGVGTLPTLHDAAYISLIVNTRH